MTAHAPEPGQRPSEPACPAPPIPAPATGDGQIVTFLSPVLYPNAYLWYVLLASLDVMLTWVILHLGGREENVLAAWIIHRFDLAGVVVFKFLTLVLVAVVCEVVGRRRRTLGRRLALGAVIVTAFPVVVALAHLLRAQFGHVGASVAGPVG